MKLTHLKVKDLSLGDFVVIIAMRNKVIHAQLEITKYASVRKEIQENLDITNLAFLLIMKGLKDNSNEPI